MELQLLMNLKVLDVDGGWRILSQVTYDVNASGWTAASGISLSGSGAVVGESCNLVSSMNLLTTQVMVFSLITSVFLQFQSLAHML